MVQCCTGRNCESETCVLRFVWGEVLGLLANPADIYGSKCNNKALTPFRGPSQLRPHLLEVVESEYRVAGQCLPKRIRGNLMAEPCHWASHELAVATDL